MSGLDYLKHSRNLTVDTYCDVAAGGFPCVGSIAEPTTMITDYVLTVVLFVLSALLLRSGWTATPGWARYWAVGFAFLGVSFAFGGSEHGFAVPLKCEGREKCIESSWVWIITLLTQTPGLALPVVGTTALIRPAWTTAAKIYAVIIVVVFSILAIVGAVATPLDGFLIGFLIVIIFSVPSVLLVLVLLSLPVCCCRTAKPSTAQVTTLVGWIVCIASLVWQGTGIGFGLHFNHNDIFHTIFIIGLPITYCGLAPQMLSAKEGDAQLQLGSLGGSHPA